MGILVMKPFADGVIDNAEIVFKSKQDTSHPECEIKDKANPTLFLKIRNPFI